MSASCGIRSHGGENAAVAVRGIAGSACGTDTPPVVCTVLDGRIESVGVRAEFFRSWLAAQHDMLALQPHWLPELSVVTLKEGHYESCLPLARHTLVAVRCALSRLEEEWVLGPLGLGNSGSFWNSYGPGGGCGSGLGSTGCGGGALLPEHAAEARHGVPLSDLGFGLGIGEHSADSKHVGSSKRLKSSVAPVRRLFAVGEDTALAALRSTLTQLTQHMSTLEGAADGHASGITSGVSVQCRLEFWTTQPERLLNIGAELKRCLPQRIELVVLAIVPVGGDDAQLSAKAKMVDAEFCSSADPRGSCNTGKVFVKWLPLAGSSFARQVRGLLDVSLPIVLRLPAVASPRELSLVAVPTLVLPLSWRRNMAAAAAATVSATGSGAWQFEVVCRIPEDGVSCELLYGVPFLAVLPPASTHGTKSGDATSLLSILEGQLRARQECLLLSARVDPSTLTPSRCLFFFIATSAATDYAALAVRGVAFADIWCPQVFPRRRSPPQRMPRYSAQPLLERLQSWGRRRQKRCRSQLKRICRRRMRQ
eukprot:TRINITY_DN9825_c0_g1_i3.p1 TRINITY_DN9825_c0_g1~~TRINITY_DN9825_c0_g1_i3.p1  ORF type:complete len:549 (+),score=84.92 TRINITY_DN9825_c0_g1_i3:39-1649(+)